MGSSMFTIGLMLKAYDDMSGIVNNAANKSIAAFGKLQQKIADVSKTMEHMGRQAAGDALMMAGALRVPLQAFADLDEASNNLRVAMMDNLGQVPNQFELINQKAVELGNRLPGTTADMYNAARALIEQGTALDMVVDGGLESAAYLATVLKLPAAEAAEMTAKLRESYGLSANELTKMADLTQRARFAFGMTPQDIKIASSYSGATQNTLGLTGIDNAKKLLALQGMGAGVSLEGSSWGTNFATLLTRTAESKDRLAKNSKEMKAINAELKTYGITLEFFNDAGNFMGVDNLVKQLEKTKNMTQVDQLNLFKKLFSTEGGRPAQIIANQGWAGYQAALDKMDRQASLMQRIDLTTRSAKNTWEAFTGTVTNLMAAIGQPIVEALQPLIVKLNELTGGPLMDWVDRHKTLVKWLGLTAIGVTLLVGGLGLLGIAMGAVGRGAGGMMTALGWLGGGLSGVYTRVMALAAMRGGMWNAIQFGLLTTQYKTLSLVGSLRTAAMAARAFSLSLLANPITWIALAIAAMAVVVWKYWKPIAGFFTGLWTGLKAGLAPLMPVFTVLGNILGKIFAPLLVPLRAVWKWFSNIFTQVEDTGGAAQRFGEKVGRAIGGVVIWVGRMLRDIFLLPMKFALLGAQIIEGLSEGMRRLAMKPVEAIMSIGKAVANGFKSLLGIHSPSQVFMGYGLNIGQGAALGVEKSLPRLQGAVKGLASVGASFPKMVGPVAGGGAAAGGDMVVHFSPQISVQGGASGADQLKSALSESYREFEAMMDRYNRERQRRAY